MEEIQVGLIGFGTVGSGTAQVLYEQAPRLEKRVGAAIRSTRYEQTTIMPRMLSHRGTNPRAILAHNLMTHLVQPAGAPPGAGLRHGSRRRRRKRTPGAERSPLFPD